MDRVLDPLADPVAGESDEDNQTDDLCGRACVPSVGRARRIPPPAAATRSAIVGLILDVDRYQRDGEPGPENQCHETADGADKKNVTETLGNVHCRLQHHHTERDAWYPADEANDSENTKQGENDGGGVIMLGEIIDGRADPEHDM